MDFERKDLAVSLSTGSSPQSTGTSSRTALRLIAGSEPGEALAPEDGRLYGESELQPDAWLLSEEDEEALLLGLPVAFAVGDDLPDRPDESVDVHQAAVLSIETARLHRFLREMTPLQSKVLRLRWGIGCDRGHTQEEVAERTSLSRTSVRRLLDRGMEELRERFGVLEAEPA